MQSSQENWVLNTVTQTEMGGSLGDCGSPKEGHWTREGFLEEGVSMQGPEGLIHISQVERGCPSQDTSTKARRREWS